MKMQKECGGGGVKRNCAKMRFRELFCSSELKTQSNEL